MTEIRINELLISAESESIYKAVKYKLVNRFSDLTPDSAVARIEAICIPEERVKKYNLKRKQDALAVLKKTNCMIIINVKCLVDDVIHAENYEMEINYGVRHQVFNEHVESVLSCDLQALGKPIGNQRFTKAQTLDVFKATAYTLSYACQYILGFVFLLSGNATESCGLLEELLIQLDNQQQDFASIDVMITLSMKRLYWAYLLKVALESKVFEKTKNESCLIGMRSNLELANRLFPDTYYYNLEMAYIYIALSGDERKAKECIAKCRQNKNQKDWKYSHAFLSAYCANSPMTVYARYKEAFQCRDVNKVNIVDYIEYILTKEPERTTLHLAAGLMYEDMGDTKLMKCHFQKYLSSDDLQGSRIESVLKAKIEANPCSERCDSDCIHCVE